MTRAIALSGEMGFHRVLGAQAAAATNAASSAIDVKDFDGVIFLVAFGAIAAPNTPRVQLESSPTSGGTYTSWGTPTALLDTNDDDIVQVVDGAAPPQRFVRALVIRDVGGGGTAVIDSVVAIGYGGRHVPGPGTAPVEIR